MPEKKTRSLGNSVLKLGVAGFAGLVCLVALILPFEARKKYAKLLVRVRETINVIF